jgi:hypothetical protein
MKRWLGVVVAVMLLMSCASADDGGADTAALCDAHEQRDELAQALLAPGVFDLSASDLDALFDDLEVLSAAMAEDADGELRDLLEQGLRFRSDANEIVLARWRADLDDLRSSGDGWTVTALEGHDELEADDGSTIATREWLAGRTQIVELLYLTCEAPQLLGGPPEDRRESPPVGIISYFQFTDISTSTGERRAVTQSGEEVDAPFALPAGWRSPLYGDAIGDRVVFSASHSNRAGLLSYTTGDDEAAIVYDGVLPVVCPSLSPTPESVLASEPGFSTEQGGAFEIEDGRVGDLRLDLAIEGCAADIGDNRLFVAPVGSTSSDPPGAALMARDGSDLRAVDLPEHCFAILGDVDEKQQHAALALRCGTPGESGLWTVDLDSFDVEHVVTGLVGTPKFSPDGTWLTYSFTPLGTRSSETAVWLAKADGTGARELVEHGAFPIWLDDGSSG